MDPTLEDYIKQIQGEAALTKADSNPFANGVNNALEATRQSMGILSREAQEQQALMMGILSYGKAMGQPSPGGHLEGINNSLGAGIDAYLQQRSQQAQMNANVYLESVRQQEALRAHQLREKQLNQQAILEGYSLQEQRRAHDLTNQHHIGTLDLHREELNLKKRRLSRFLAAQAVNSSVSPSGINEVPLQKMGKQFANDWGKLVVKEISQIPINQRTVSTVQEMKDIFEKYPNIGSSFLNMIDNEEGKTENSFWNMLAKKVVNDDELSAVQQLKKLSNDLTLSTVKGLSGTSATDIMKKAVKASSPSGRLTHDSFNKIADSWSKRANENIRHAKLIENSLSRGMYPMSGEVEINPSPLSSERSSIEGNDLSQLSDEELLKLYNNE